MRQACYWLFSHDSFGAQQCWQDMTSWLAAHDIITTKYFVLRRFYAFWRICAVIRMSPVSVAWYTRWSTDTMHLGLRMHALLHAYMHVWVCLGFFFGMCPMLCISGWDMLWLWAVSCELWAVTSWPQHTVEVHEALVIHGWHCTAAAHWWHNIYNAKPCKIQST